MLRGGYTGKIGLTRGGPETIAQKEIRKAKRGGKLTGMAQLKGRWWVYIWV